MCHPSGSNHPSSPTCPAPLTYLSPLLRVSSSFLCLLSSTVPLSSCICPISFPCLVLSSLLVPLSFEPAISSFICFLPSPLTASPLITWHVPSYWLQSSQPRPSYLSVPSPARLFLFPLSLILYCPSFFLYICPISVPCLVLSSLLVPLSFEPAISSFISFLPSPLTGSPLITWRAPS